VRCQDPDTLGEMPRERLLVRCQEETLGEMPRDVTLGEMPRVGTFGEMPGGRNPW
jgi:hypothetical protein